MTSAPTIRLFVVAVLVLVNSGADIKAQSRAVSRDADHKQYLLEGIAARCEATVSASFAATGRFKQKYESQKWVVPEGDIHLKGAFDKGRLRFDYGRPEYVLAPEVIARRLKQHDFGNEEAKKLSSQPLNADPKEFVLATVETYFVSRPDKVAYWFNGNPTVFLVAPNEPVPSGISRFDLKALGLYGWLEFKKAMNVEELLDAYRKNKTFEVENLDGELWRLSLLFDGRFTSSRWEMDINAGEGFTPVQARMTEIPKSGGEPRVIQSSSVAWEKKNEAWVPVKYQIQKGIDHSSNFTSIELTFTYDRVNESIDDSVFSHESFPTPKFVGVIDASGAKPVVVRGHYKGDNPSTLDTEKQSAPGIGRLLVLVNVVMLVAILALFCRSWIRKRRSLD